MAETKQHYERSSKLFYFGHVLPLVISICVQNECDEHYRTSWSAIIIYCTSGVMMIVQAILLRNEVLSAYRDDRIGIPGVGIKQVKTFGTPVVAGNFGGNNQKIKDLVLKGSQGLGTAVGT